MVHQGVVDVAVAVGLLGAEEAVADGVEGALEPGVGFVDLAGAVGAGADRGDLLDGVAENEDIVGAHLFADLHVGAVEGADGEGPVEGELHVAGARGLGAGGGDLLGEVGRRDDQLGQAHPVVGDEHHLQAVADARVVVDRGGHVVDEADHQLGEVVGRGRLAGEDHHPRHPVGARVGQDGLVAGDHVQHIEQLPLVFVHALHVHVEHGIGVERDAQLLLHVGRQALLVGALDGAEAGHEAAVVLVVAQAVQQFELAPPVGAEALVDQRGEARVGLGQPAAWGPLPFYSNQI